MALPTMRTNVTSREFLRVAGGYHAPAEGSSPAGGLDVDNSGNLATDGAITVDGSLSTGSLDCTGNAAVHGILSTADLRFSGDLEVGTGGCNKIWTRFVGGNELIRMGGTSAAYIAYNSSNVYIPVVKLPADAIYQVGFATALPSDYDGSSLSFRVFWSSTDGTSGNVKWNVRPNILKDGESLDLVTGTGYQNFIDTFQALKTVHIATATLTPGYATAGDKLLTILLQRRSTDTEDTFDGEVHLIGMEISY